jgi:hypothetical protein
VGAPNAFGHANAPSLREAEFQSASPKEDQMRNLKLAVLLCTCVLVSGQQLLAADPVPQQGAEVVVAGMPTGPSPVGKPPKLYSLTITYTNPAGNIKTVNIKVPDIPVTQGLPNPTAAQVAAASAAKQEAIIAAINAANIAIQPTTINGVTYNTLTAVANAKPEPGGMFPTGQTMQVQLFNKFGQPTGRFVTVPVLAPADFSTYTVNGMTQTVIDPGTLVAKLGGGVYRTKGNTVTGEAGNGKQAFTPGSSPGGALNPPSTGDLAQATFTGLGALSQLTSGVDWSGNPSMIGFGFIDETGATPIDYIAAIDPTSGMTDAQVLTDLEDLFNQDYSADGYTASYDPFTDTLSINQLLPLVDFTWSSDTDTTMYVEDSMNTFPTPEPGALLLTGTGLTALAVFLRRRSVRI